MKKKIVIAITAVLSALVVCLLSSCSDKSGSDELTQVGGAPETIRADDASLGNKKTTAANPPIEDAEAPGFKNAETASSANNGGSQNDGKGGCVISVGEYRSLFYTIPWPFIKIIGREAYSEWTVTEDALLNSGKTLISDFIKRFGITREQFDRANVEWARIVRDGLHGRPCVNPKDYANQIMDEIYNADIVYTLNDKLIRQYYLSPDYPYLYDDEFDEAVAKGEYKPQTEKWIDVEEMEAEINAKYGPPAATESSETQAA